MAMVNRVSGTIAASLCGSVAQADRIGLVQMSTAARHCAAFVKRTGWTVAVLCHDDSNINISICIILTTTTIIITRHFYNFIFLPDIDDKTY